MGHRSYILVDKPIIELDEIDSTNNYAMRLIDADTAQDGMTITARRQIAGKGQRGKQWEADEGLSLLMSVIVKPKLKLEDQFILCAVAALSVIEALEFLDIDKDLKIKWTNDVIINDKKTAGVLIENVLRGDTWNYAVIGIGLNVLQRELPLTLPYATSLKMTTGKDFDLMQLREQIRYRLFDWLDGEKDPDDIMKVYNDYLFKKGQWQEFSNDSGSWQAEIIEVSRTGKLKVRDVNGEEHYYTHGSVVWKWG